MSNQKLININTLYIILIIFIGCLLRFAYFIDIDAWFDEWNMLYTIDPNISTEDTWNRYYGDRGDHNLPEYYPPLNAFFLKFILGISDYNIENTRLLSLIFGSGSLYLIFYLSKIFTNFKYSILTTSIASLNLFLIWQSAEIRPHSFVVFFSLLSIILFLKILNKNFSENKVLLFFYFLTSLILLSSWPFALIIFFAKFIFLFHEFILLRKINKKIFFLLSLIILFYIFFNYNYLLYHLARDEHYTKLKLSFFYSYHFRSFFGSIPLGAIFLILFSFLLIKNFKNIFHQNSKDNLLLSIILSSYFLTISYSIISASVISPKYVIFILPIIIIWIVLKIETLNFKFKNILIISLISTVIFNCFINFKKNPIDRPPTKKILDTIIKSDIDRIYTNESEVFNNFIKIHKIFKKNNLKIDKVSNIQLKNKFWFLCLNNPRFAGRNINFPVEKKCKVLDDNKSLILIEEIKITDYILRKYEKKI